MNKLPTSILTYSELEEIINCYIDNNTNCKFSLSTKADVSATLVVYDEQRYYAVDFVVSNDPYIPLTIYVDATQLEVDAVASKDALNMLETLFSKNDNLRVSAS